MNLLFLYFLLSFLFGTVALVFSFLILSMIGDGEIILRIFVLFGFLLLVLYDLIAIYFDITSHPGNGNIPLPEIGMVLLIFSLPLYVNEISLVPFRKIVNRIFIVLGSIAGILTAFGISMFSRKYYAFCFLFTACSLILSIIYSSLISLIFNSNGKGEDRIIRISFGTAGLLMLSGFVFVDILQVVSVPGFPETNANIVTVPLFYILLSFLLIRKDMRFLKLSAKSSHQSVSLDTACDDCNLSPREREVAKLLLTGLSYSEIGNSLCISHATVKTHIKNIYQKFGVSGKMDLVQKMFVS